MTEKTDHPFKPGVRVATLRPWNTDISAMPAEGHFEVLREYREVYRCMPDEKYVIEPSSGRMFVPFAWRPADQIESALPAPVKD